MQKRRAGVIVVLFPMVFRFGAVLLARFGGVDARDRTIYRPVGYTANSLSRGETVALPQGCEPMLPADSGTRMRFPIGANLGICMPFLECD